MAKDGRKDREDENEEKKELVQQFRIRHNLNSGELIRIRGALQRHYSNMPGYNIDLDFVDKQGDKNGIFLKATETQAGEVKKDLEKKALLWKYDDAKFWDPEIAQKVPDGIHTAEEMRQIEIEVAGGISEELRRLYEGNGALETKLSLATEQLLRIEQRSSVLENSKLSLESSNYALEQRLDVLDKTHKLLKSGNFADAVKLLIGLRLDGISEIEFMLSEIKDSGLDFEFIAKPPASLEMYVGQIISKAFGINFTDISKRLRVGKVDWDKSEIYVPVSEKNDAVEKVAALVKTIETADESVRQILVDNLGKVVDDFRKKINEYEGKFAEWQKAKEIYFAHEKAMEKGKAEIASAKGLQGCLSEIKQVKLPVYAVPEQDSITLFTPVSKGILYDSFMAAVKDAAVISSEPQILNGNTVLRITGKNGSWKPLEVLSSIRESYQNSEAGKMGGRLGLLVQL